jgi:hypothetical protein
MPSPWLFSSPRHRSKAAQARTSLEIERVGDLASLSGKTDAGRLNAKNRPMKGGFR